MALQPIDFIVEIATELYWVMLRARLGRNAIPNPYFLADRPKSTEPLGLARGHTEAYGARLQR